MPDLTTRTARRRLRTGRDKHWTRIARGRALGYYRGPGAPAGTWHVRLFGGARYHKRALGTADDAAAADGAEVLTYGQAVERALAWDENEEPATPEDAENLTVREAVERYLGWYKDHRRAYQDARYVFEAHILPELGQLPLTALTTDRLRRWHQKLASAPARLRGGHLRPARTEDQKRARKATANHALTALKAALNRAVEDGEAEVGAWRNVKPFRGVETSRTRFLEPEELRRLLNACEPDFRDLAAAAVHTGARYSELAALDVGDYKPEARAVHFRSTKAGPERYVYLSDEGEALFERLTAGRGPRDRMLLRSDGNEWGKNYQQRRIEAACTVAGIEPTIRFHALRHSYASAYLMNGGSLIAVAKQLGHADTRMVERHYGHLADSWRAEEARKHAPKIDAAPRRVVRLRRRR